MATLVLSTVGSLLGGPVGGAIGSLVGQSIDQQIFGTPRRGPRLGDLSVQTSSYGTQIPRIYGTMRVAGSIIWSTDLVESTQTSGAKGQPDTTFSYSVSFAVALSSRPLLEIRRIWADGKLLRGEAGDFKVSTEFRFYSGTEAQDVDPLIASIESSENTPAYRGLALAVFENLELAEFGNRIPFLTFEVVADAAAPSITAILAHVSGGVIGCDDLTPIIGYAITGPSIRSAIEPLIESFAVDLVDQGSALGSPVAGTLVAIAEADLGNSADEDGVPRLEREQTSARSLPSSLSITYYDAERDYHTGQAHSEMVDQTATESRVELPAVIAASDARALAEEMIARRWAQRDKLILRLPPSFITLEPGAILQIPSLPVRWQVQRLTIEGLVAVTEVRPLWRSRAALIADSGRALPDDDFVIADVALALVELPDLTGRAGLTPTVHVAASAATPAWKRLPVEISGDQFALGCRTARRKSTMGYARTVLDDGPVDVIDSLNSVEVELTDADQWLVSCDDEALAAGANLALIADELIQFGDVEPIGPGRFRLSRLLRGKYSTEWATATHATDDLFLLIDFSSLQPMVLPASARGTVVTATCRTSASTMSDSRLIDGRSMPRGLFIHGEQVVGARQSAIASPAGGTVIDAEGRESIMQILATLRHHGLINT
jgi:hypothetical protein